MLPFHSRFTAAAQRRLEWRWVQMSEFHQIAVINTGWSEDYNGGQVVGDFDYLAKGVGHERYNFRPDLKGRYFGYAPPLGENQSPPKPVSLKDWLVFFVSKRPGQSGLYLVGWYENATFVASYKVRPDADDLGLDSDGGKFSYTVTSSQGYFVPLPLRTMKVKGNHLKRSYAYLRGNVEMLRHKGSDGWRNDLARELLRFREKVRLRVSAEENSGKSVLSSKPQDAKKRKLVEERSVDAVKAHFSAWICESKETQNLGYDLLLKSRKTGEEMHVEVKGTSLDEPNFFISKNEYEYAKKLSLNDQRARRNLDGSWRPLWRLAMVHDALAKAAVNVHTFSEMEKLFEVSPIAWRGILKGGQ